MMSALEARKSSSITCNSQEARVKNEIERSILKAINKGVFEVKFNFFISDALENEFSELGYEIESLTDVNECWTRIYW